jgi:hypothetical protein
MLSIDVETRRLNALRAIVSGLLRLKWLAAATRFEIAMHRHARALKYGFNPDQPRVPRGNPHGGYWTDAGGGGQATGTRSASRRIRLAGVILTNESPEIPKERPPTSRERSKVQKTVARWLDRASGTIETVGAIAKLSSWLQTYSAQIESYRDPPKSLEELQQAVSTPAPGYDIHHIVEQTQAERDGFTREVIDSPDNLVRIPRLKHQEINAWYQEKNRNFGGMPPREYLSGRNWDVRRSVGLDALRDSGVLK